MGTRKTQDLTTSLVERRARLLGPNVQTFYAEPVHLVRGEGVWVWDAEGRRYLDCYNNVPHVGHCHPRVVEAICRQAATLNTHTRYLHETILDYIEQLTATFDTSLSTATLTCTGSEANDLALRIAAAVTGRSGIVSTDCTYHGNTMVVAQLSHTNTSADSLWPNIRRVPAPDSYRGAADAKAFAGHVESAIAELTTAGHGVSALIVCPYFANEGFPELPAGWLDGAVKAVREAGGLVIADEVQPGFGRLGSHMWGHQRIGFTPDIVTLGKPMANGHPVGGVVTTAGHMATFRKNARYFNTFGGNPVSAAAALATFAVLKEERLQENAKASGAYARTGLERLARKHAMIGDVRGSGLFFGAEMVLDRKSKAPATQLAKRVADEMRRRGILLNTLGINGNTLKIRPPMPFSRENADFLIETLDAVLAETPVET